MPRYHIARDSDTNWHRFMTANRTVRTGLTASAVISVCLSSALLMNIANGCAVMALDNSYSRILLHRLRLRRIRTILVCRRMQSYDRLFCSTGYFLQEKDS